MRHVSMQLVASTLQYEDYDFKTYEFLHVSNSSCYVLTFVYFGLAMTSLKTMKRDFVRNRKWIS